MSARRGDRAAGLSEHVEDLLEVLEPVLILLSLCGHATTRLLVAGAATDVALELPFDTAMRMHSTPRQSLPTEILDALVDEPTVVVGLRVTSRTLALTTTGLRGGWFVVPVPGAASKLDLSDLLSELGGPLEQAEAELLDAIEAATGGAELADLAMALPAPSGLVTMFDPAGWSVLAGDADTDAIVELGSAASQLIDDAGIRNFVSAEVERERSTRIPLRERFDDERTDRQLLRRAMRGARRRQDDASADGLGRAFRIGRSRRLTYTEFLMACHDEGVVDVLHRLDQVAQLPHWDFGGEVHGEPGQRYVFATLAPPLQGLERIEPTLMDPPSPQGELVLTYRRWGEEHAVGSAVPVGALSLTDGRLSRPLALVDGAEVTPTLGVHVLVDDSEVLLLAGVQHGDVLVLTDQDSGTRADLAIVKNYTRHDDERLRAAGYALAMAAPFDIDPLADTLVSTIRFALADGPNTAQEAQRVSLIGSVPQPFPPTGQPRADPATLDIPSARGVGVFPDDCSYTHLCGPVGMIPTEVTSLVSTHLGEVAAGMALLPQPSDVPHHSDRTFRDAVGAHHEAMSTDLAAVVAQCSAITGATTVWHTYEDDAAARPAYIAAGNRLWLWPGDPIRNIRTDHGGEPTLFTVQALEDAPAAGLDEQGLAEVIELALFVNRQAEVKVYLEPDDATSTTSHGEALQVADALASLVDGGRAPSGTAGEPEPEPDPDPEPEPDEPQSTVASATIRVVDDGGGALPFVIVTVTVNGASLQTAKSGADGEVLLADVDPSRIVAVVTGYPGHQDGIVAFDLEAGDSIDVDLVLRAIPASAELPPLTGVIVESSGFFVRQLPGSTEQILGKLHYTSYDVTVLEARVIETDWGPKDLLIPRGKIDDLWYRVRFAPDAFLRVVDAYDTVLQVEGDMAKITAHAAALADHQGTEAWVGKDAMSVVAMPWDHFLELLHAFELTNVLDTLPMRLSRLRQIGENADVPGDDSVGCALVKNPINITDREPKPEKWSLLLESKQVVLADGEILDIHHFLLGVDGLIDDGRKGDDRTVYFWLDKLLGTKKAPLRLGESYSALTWSGDVGAAVSDMVRHESPDWEEAAARRAPDKKLTPGDLRAFYFRTRCPDFDLLADIDAWGAYRWMPHRDGSAHDAAFPPVSSIYELVTKVYGPPGPWTPHNDESRQEHRSRGVWELLTHYGFTNPAALQGQAQSVDLMERQLRIFAPTWWLVKEVKGMTVSEWGNFVVPTPPPGEFAEMVTESGHLNMLFLTWMQQLAATVGLTVLTGSRPGPRP